MAGRVLQLAPASARASKDDGHGAAAFFKEARPGPSPFEARRPLAADEHLRVTDISHWLLLEE
jgi:hypothetical protein